MAFLGALTTLEIIKGVASIAYFALKKLKSSTYDNNAKITSIDPTLPRPAIYGMHKAAGNIIYQRLSDNKKWMHLFVAFCQGHPDGWGIEGYSGIRINDIPIEEFGDNASVTEYYGTNDQVVDERCPGGAAVVGSLHGIAYLAVSVKRGDRVSGIPNVTAIVKGRKIRKWDGSAWSEPAWSNNPIWCMVDLMMDPLSGAGWPEEIIDLDAAKEAADYCDELYDGEHKRFTLDVVVDWRESFLETFNKLRYNCRAFMTWRNGKVTLQVSRPGTSQNSYHVGSGGPNLFSRESMSLHGLSADEEYDEVRVWYTDPDAGWSRQYVAYKGAEVSAPNILEIQLYGTKRRIQAALLAKFYYLFYKYCNLTGTSQTSIAGSDDMPGDYIDITWDVFGWDRQQVEIETMEASEDHKITFGWRIYDERIFVDDGASDSGATVDTLPNPWAQPPDVTGLTVSQVNRINNDKTWSHYLAVSWTEAEGAYIKGYQPLISLDGGVTFQKWGAVVEDSSAEIGPLAINDSAGVPIEYVVMIKTINSEKGHDQESPGAVSVVVNLTGDVTPPATPTVAPSVVAGIKQLTVICSVPGDVDIAAIKIRRQSAPAEHDAANKRYIVPAVPEWGDWVDVADVATTTAGALASWVDSGASATNQCFRYSFLVEDGSGNASGWSPESGAYVPAAVEEQDLGDALSSRLARVQVRQAIQQCVTDSSTGKPEFLSPGTGRAVNLDCLTFGDDFALPENTISGGDDPEYPKENAVDWDYNTYWRAAQIGTYIPGNAFIGIHITGGQRAKRLYLSHGARANSIDSGIIQGSYDGQNWIDIKTVTLKSFENIIILPDNDYEYIIMRANSIPGNNEWRVYEFGLRPGIGGPFIVSLADGFDDIIGQRDWLVSINESIPDAWSNLPPAVTITSLTRSGTVGTCICSGAHGFPVGAEVTLSDVTTAGWGGPWIITAVPAADTFQFTVPDTLTTPAVLGAAPEARPTVFLLIARDAVTGEISFPYTLLPPNDDPTGPAAPVEDQHWFDPSRYVMYRYDGAAWAAVQRLPVGECVTIGMGIAAGSIVCYALQGRYDSGWFSIATSQDYPKAHNLGCLPVADICILLRAANGRIAKAKYWTEEGRGVLITNLKRNSLEMTTGTSLVDAVDDQNWGTDAHSDLAATRARIIVQRGY
jgi:hypothetical protein